jgi:hypothetical protein
MVAVLGLGAQVAIQAPEAEAVIFLQGWSAADSCAPAAGTTDFGDLLRGARDNLRSIVRAPQRPRTWLKLRRKQVSMASASKRPTIL